VIAKHHEMVLKDHELPPVPVLLREIQVAEAPRAEAPDIAAWLAELDRPEKAKRAVIDAMNFVQLLDYAIFGGWGRSLVEIQEIVGVWQGNFALRDLILTYPRHTAYVGQLADQELGRLVPTDDQIYNAAVRRLRLLIFNPNEEHSHQWPGNP
jgi:hypothetical protein